MRLLIVVVLLAALAYFVWNQDKPAQPAPVQEQAEQAAPEKGMIEEHLLAPMSRAEEFKDNSYNEALDKHREEMDKQQ